MLELFLTLNNKINAFIWGPVVIFVILGTGIYLTVGSGFIQFRKFIRALKEVFTRRGRRGEGDISPFQALSVALGGTVGVGNITGVATAISLGGPGAIFWMWVSGIVGMATKFSEVVLGINYRIRQFRQPMLGGPMAYIIRGMGRRYRVLSGAFALFGALAAFGIGNMTQANSVAQGALEFGIPRQVTGIVLMLLVGLVIIGGIKRIAQVAVVLVPFMCIIYLTAAFIIIILKFSYLPEALGLIVKSAFSPQAATGGFLGFSVREAMRWGIARGVFSNEAGLGSASIAHATAKTDHPVRQGLWGILEVFIDTIIVCTFTALVIIITNSWQDGQTGALLTMSAFGKVFGQGMGRILVLLCMAMTAYDTILAWGFYGETCCAYLFGPAARDYYRIFWLPFVLIGALGRLEVIWDIADTLNGLMALPNLIALIFLSPVVFRLTREFFERPPKLK